MKVKQHGRKDQRCEIERARERERGGKRNILVQVPVSTLT